VKTFRTAAARLGFLRYFVASSPRVKTFRTAAARLGFLRYFVAPQMQCSRELSGDHCRISY